MLSREYIEGWVAEVDAAGRPVARAKEYALYVTCLALYDEVERLNKAVDYAVQKRKEAIDEGMEILQEKNRLRSRLALADALAEAVEAVSWVFDCRCDAAYTDRGKHEPNAICGEDDDVRAALAAYREARDA